MTPDEANALRWTNTFENYYEVYYLTLNHRASIHEACELQDPRV